ncbi:hypothetical protein C6499_19335 [Candidatus Poribacteria bacterium]|nr:MAG: hypothetical protein C6499_19335 [Candidatus Poribacteria bacterium]
MHFRQKLFFMAFGSILTLAGYLLATLAGDVTAQPETDKTTFFDAIVCRDLQIVDPSGHPVARIHEFQGDGGIIIHDKNRGMITLYGGKILTTNGDGKTVFSAGNDNNAGEIEVNHANGERAITMGTAGETKEGFMTINRKDGDGSIQLGLNEYGGSVNYPTLKGLGLCPILGNFTGFSLLSRQLIHDPDHG